MNHTPNTEQRERAEFEAWARPFYILDRTSEDKYEYQGAYIAWFAWQAARATQAAPASPNTGAVGWLIEWKAPDGANDYVFFKHNGIGDYRALYPSATVRELVERTPATPSPSKGGEAGAAKDNSGKEA